MPELYPTPHALVQTNSGKRFYVNSGLISADNTETTIIDIDNIGERDIRLNLNPVLTTASGDEMTMKIYSNGVITYQCVYNEQQSPNSNIVSRFIFASNTSLKITFTNQDSSSHNVGVSCYGKFV